MANDTDFTIASGREIRLLAIDQQAQGSNLAAPDPCLYVNLSNPAARVH